MAGVGEANQPEWYRLLAKAKVGWDFVSTLERYPGESSTSPGSNRNNLAQAEKTAALLNLKKFCEEHMAFRYRIEVIDLLQKPQLAQGDQILALPTLVRRLPEPIRRVIGDLSNTERVFVGLDLRPRDPGPLTTGSASVPFCFSDPSQLRLQTRSSDF